MSQPDAPGDPESGTTVAERAGGGPRAAAALVRVRSAEEAAYGETLAAVETRRQRAADLQAELEALKDALGRFEAEYHARVGVRFVELDRVRLAVDEYGRRLDRLRADLWLDLTDLERDLSGEFGDRRQGIDDEEAEARRYQQAHARDAERPHLGPDEEAELRRIYRDLARRYHPDLARTDAERVRREEMMLQVNAAFHERDLPALRALHGAGEVDDPSFEARPVGEKLAWAAREVARLDGVIVGLVGELAAVRGSATHALWRRHEADAALLDTLSSDLDREIAAARERLDGLVGTYRGLLAERRSA